MTVSIVDINTNTNTNLDNQILRKIEEVTAGLAYSHYKNLRSVRIKSASIIADYIKTMKSEVNLSDTYR